jgi:hypothetical protein
MWLRDENELKRNASKRRSKRMNAKEEQVQERIAQMKNAPRHVKAAVLWSLALGMVALGRFLATAYAGRLTWGKAALYGGLLLGWFFLNGYSLYERSKWGFVALVAMAVLPVLGILGLSVHLVRLTLEGTLTANWPDTIVSVMGLLQLVITCILFRHLLSKEVREYVWTPTKRTFV